MSFVNSIITYALPYMPKWFARTFAKPYVAGENIDDALSIVQDINNKGFKATIDILGEHVTEIDFAREITSQYCILYDKIEERLLDCTISIKPTHIGLYISDSEAEMNIIRIAKKAEEYGNFLRIDMESSKFTQQTFKLYENCKDIYDNVGVAIQSYLYRSQNDVVKYGNNTFNSRICKGIYKEPETIAFKNKDDIRNNFLMLAKTMASTESFCGYATHDQILIDKLLKWIREENIPSHLFEFQVLYGVPMGNRLNELTKDGFTVRVYVPFGPEWFDYSVRRLKENPNIGGYVLSNFFKRF